MKIVILDAYTTIKDDLNFDSIKTSGELIVYSRTSPNEVDARIKDAEIVVTNKTPISKKTIENAKNLKMISVLATGYNVVDVAFAKANGITVCNAPNYSTQSVSQLVFAYILNIYNKVHEHSDWIKSGAWSNSSDFSYTLGTLHELAGKTIGIVGYGQIGKRVKLIAESFGMRVLFTCRSDVPGKTDLMTLLKESDIVTLHCSLNETTRYLINNETLSYMKPESILINTARGDVVSENDVIDALNKNKIAYYCADVCSKEPIERDNALLHNPHVILTPHLGWATFEARKRLVQITKENIAAYLNGKPINVVG